MARSASVTDIGQALQLDQQLCFALYSASLAVTKAYKPLLDPLGLTYPQYLVMLALWSTDDLPVSALGERVALDSGTLTPLLKRLEAAGLLQRQRDAADERRVLIRLTLAGKRLRSKAAPIPGRLLQSMDCSRDELTALTHQITALRDQVRAQSRARTRDGGLA